MDVTMTKEKAEGMSEIRGVSIDIMPQNHPMEQSSYEMYIVEKNAVKSDILQLDCLPLTITLDCGCTLTIKEGDVIRTVECKHSTPEQRRYLTKVTTP